MNPLFQMMQNQNPMSNNIIARFNQFRQSFRGDARQQIQQMLNSGQITQDQYNQAMQMAPTLQQMLRG